jgi:hypothetical protein
MMQKIKEGAKTLDISSKLRKDMRLRSTCPAFGSLFVGSLIIQFCSLKSQGVPITSIAVRRGKWPSSSQSVYFAFSCFTAISTSKSPVLNAILDGTKPTAPYPSHLRSCAHNIALTSGMRTCTAAVMKIAHHAKTIAADVPEATQRQEHNMHLQDPIDEEGNLKRSTDLNSVAQQKVICQDVSYSGCPSTKSSPEIPASVPSHVALSWGL